MRPILRNQCFAVALLVGSAVARLPVEEALTADFRAEQLLPPKLDTSLRDQMSQESFAAAAGGLRSLIASYYEVEAFIAFHQSPPRWDQVDKYYTLCCQLQPRTTHYWDMYGWMLAKNAAESYATEGEATTGREAELRAYYRDKGLGILLRGITHNPDSYQLYRQAAALYSEGNRTLNPHPDYAKSAALYLRASQCPDAHTASDYPPAKYLYRFYLYDLARIPGQEAKAYAELLALYHSSAQEDFPTTITTLKSLEERLGIPLMERIPAAAKTHPRRPLPKIFFPPPPLPLRTP